jgi:hypothetical protein
MRIHRKLMKPYRIALLVVPAAIVGALAFAQGPSSNPAPAQPPTIGTLNFESNLGSFKLIDGSGRVEVSFVGTVMVNGLKGTITPSGNLRKEYEGKGRTAYFGSGKLVIDGQFRGIQAFGKKFKGVWRGRGMARLYGEFDDQLNTGFYWYDDIEMRQYWSPYGSTLELPERKIGGNAIPQERPKARP